MKNLIVLCFAAFLSQAAFAQTTGMVKKTAATAAIAQTAQFQVWGNCGMCKKTIEKAAKSVTGVETAEWNVETHQFSVAFNSAKTSVDKVHQAIAAAGYDTDLVKGNDAAYNKLHGCCQYERRQ
ncbi:MAG: heavy-metal-associated domain-containing protein [Saprospiraceae bacterium]